MPSTIDHMFNIVGCWNVAGETDILKWLAARIEKDERNENAFDEQEKNRASTADLEEDQVFPFARKSDVLDKRKSNRSSAGTDVALLETRCCHTIAIR